MLVHCLSYVFFQENSSDEANSGWVESGTELTTPAVAHQNIVENSSLEKLHQYKHISTDPPRNQFTEERNIRHVINPIDIPKMSYQELEAELNKSKTHVRSTNEDVMDGGPPSFDQEDLGDHASTLDQGVADMVISQKDSEISRKDITTETTVVTVHKQVTDVPDDQVSVSLLDDVPGNAHQDNASSENDEVISSEYQVSTSTR